MEQILHHFKSQQCMHLKRCTDCHSNIISLGKYTEACMYQDRSTSGFVHGPPGKHHTNMDRKAKPDCLDSLLKISQIKSNETFVVQKSIVCPRISFFQFRRIVSDDKLLANLHTGSRNSDRNEIAAYYSLLLFRINKLMASFTN